MASSDHHDIAGVIAPPPLIYLGGLLLGLLAHALIPARLLQRDMPLIGGLLAGLGSVIGLNAIMVMHRHNTSPMTEAPSTALVTGGIFRYSRNPIYLAFILIYIGLTLVFNTIWPLLILPGVLVVMIKGVIEREERYLERKFGAAYRHYKAQTRRWL
jgi:protein-S-isoprenylcysteine O-methyltransferase Ste14